MPKISGSGNDHLVDKRKNWEARVEVKIFALRDLSTYDKLVYTILCGHANKEGTAYPHVQTIADEASCSVRQVRRALSALEACSLLVRRPQISKGYGQTFNIYEIYGAEAYTPPDCQAGGGVPDGQGAGDCEAEPIDEFKQPLINKDPSPLTPQGEGTVEPKKSDTPKTEDPDVCETVVGLYNTTLPTLPTAAKLTEQRRRAIRVRIRDDPARKDPEWWRSFFGQVRQYPWLMGENPDSKGWKADLDWLLKPGNLQKVLEGRYPRRLGTTGRTEAAEAVQKQYMREGGTVDARALLRNTP